MRRFSPSRLFPTAGFFSEVAITRRYMFLVSIEYRVELSEIEKHLESHRAFLEKCYQQKIFILSGRKIPRTGGVIIASVQSREVLESILESDPFKKNQLASYEITEFLPTMYDSDLTNIISRESESREGFNFK